MSIKRKVITSAAAASLAIATPLIATWEGLETKPYQDIGGVLTVCYGETQGVENREYTPEECENMLADRVIDYYNPMIANVSKPEKLPITMGRR
jgi:lysozyme